MCNAANATIMRAVVDSLINDEKAFTAFDATQMGMQRGTTERHSHLKGQVHANMQSEMNAGTYERSLVPTPSGRDAWLYHPIGFDVQSYIDKINDVKSVTPTQFAPPVDPDGDGSIQVGGLANDLGFNVHGDTAKEQETDAAGRLPIYGDMLRTISCGPLTIVEVGNVNDEMVIAENLGVHAVKSYTVNADGRIRIGAETIEAILSVVAGATGRKFKIQLDADLERIVVTL